MVNEPKRTVPKTDTVRVAIAKATDYNVNELRGAIRKSLELIGGLESFIKRGNKVFVKINLLSPPSSPEKGIITHPIFAEAVIGLLKETGAEITIGDDIEGGESGFKVSGYREMCERVNVKLINLREAGFVSTKGDGKLLKEILLSKLALEADVIINLPKLKTHSLAMLTLGVKNMYGVIPGGVRSRLHGEYPRNEDFSQMLVDIFALVRPQLTIMDGVVAMEGEGPAAGRLRKLGVILASRDTVALDAITSRILGIDPQILLTTHYAGERGLGISDTSKIIVMGEKVELISIDNFKLPISMSQPKLTMVPQAVAHFAIEQLAPRPYVIKKNCTACSACVGVCPAGAATIIGKTADINKKLCIKCMCCHEACRFNAIVPRRPFSGTLIFGIIKMWRKGTRK